MPETTPAGLERAMLRPSHPALLWKKAGGMRVIERQLFCAARAGIKAVWICARRPDEAAGLRLPDGLRVHWPPTGTETFVECEAPYLALSGDHFLRVNALNRLVRENPAESVSFRDPSGASAARIVTDRESAVSQTTRALPADDSRRVADSPDLISWLMVAGPKSQDGFMARHFDRRLSGAVSRALLDTAVTPNMMTLFSTVLGLIGASLFLGPSRLWYIPGALIVWLHSVLDGCDGELARVRFQESARGSDLDFWGDNVVHLALFTCLGLGFWRTGNGIHTLALAAVADLGVLASAWTAWQHRRRRRAAVPGPEAGVIDQAAGDDLDSKLARLENALAQRDFIYLLVLLAFVDCVYEFLWAAAIGGLLYFAIMLHLRRVNNHEPAQELHPAR